MASKIKSVVQQTADGEILHVYASAKDAADDLEIMRSAINRACNGRQPYAGGYKWRYQTEEELHPNRKADSDNKKCLVVKGETVRGWAIDTIEQYGNVALCGPEINGVIKAYGIPTLETYIGIKIGKKVQIRKSMYENFGYIAEVVR